MAFNMSSIRLTCPLRRLPKQFKTFTIKSKRESSEWGYFVWLIVFSRYIAQETAKLEVY